LGVGPRRPYADHGFLDLTKHFRGESDKNVWSVIVGAFQTLNRMSDQPWLAPLVRDRLTPAVQELGWAQRPGESELTGQLRGDLLRALGTVGDDVTCRNRAAELFAEPSSDANVLRGGRGDLAHVGGAARYEEFAERFSHGADAAGRAALLARAGRFL